MTELPLWKHYLLDMPRYAMTNRYTLPDHSAREQEPFFVAGAEYLRQQLGERFTDLEAGEIARRASWVRVWRESDTYTALGLGPDRQFSTPRLLGREHLEALRDATQPIFMLTAHVGSFYFAFQELAACGFDVYPVARSVDRSSATPRATQRYLDINYRLSGRRLNRGHYLYTDYDGRFDRKIVEATRSGGKLIPNLLDMPPRLYPGKRAPVEFLGKTAHMPINFIQWASKKRGIFLTYWTGYESDFSSSGKPRRFLQIEPPIIADTPEQILQAYVSRLEAHVAAMPWNWMALPIAEQYHHAPG